MLHELTFQHQGYNIVFAFENESDLRVIEAMQTKLGAFQKTSLKESKQSQHLCFKLNFLGERLDMGIEENAKNYFAARGLNCLYGMTLYIDAESRKHKWTLSNVPSQQLCTYTHDRNRDPRLNLTPESVEKLAKQIDDTIQKLKTESKNKASTQPATDKKETTQTTSPAEHPAPARGKFEDFKTAYYLAYRKAFFKNPFSLMKRCLDKNMIFSIEQIEEYAKRHPKTRTATVLKSIRP